MRRLLALLLLAACSTSSSSSSPPADAGTEADTDRTFGGSRPVSVRVPAGYDGKTPLPLLLMLHGYGSGGIITDIYVKMTSIADAKGFFYVAPDGTIDSQGKHFWNATDACCDMDKTGVDDVAYLTGLVNEISGAYAIDKARIFVMGHSNGGFMAHRLACDHAEMFAAAVSFAGAVWLDASRCTPSAPVGILQIQGTKDEEVLYQGAPDYPGAEQTVATWAAKNGCAPALTGPGASLRVNADSTSMDTSVMQHDGCAKNGAAELWPVQGAPHIFTFTPEAVLAVWTFLDGHHK
jgi:polyhydroxybutyrate depolymerase